MIALAAAACAGLAAWWQTSGPRARLGRRRARPSRAVLGAAVAGGGALVAVVLTPALAVLGLGAGVIAGTVVTRWRRHRRRTRRQARAAAGTETVLVLAAALRAGLPPAVALGQVAEEEPVVRAAARAALHAGDVPGALRGAARGPGDEALTRLAVAWQVAEQTGAPVADVLDRLSDVERDERDLRREVEAGVAPARATAALMAMLPVFGLVIGSGFGGDPAWVLVTSHLLVATAVSAGAALACAGMLWIDRIADAAEAS